MLIIHVDTFGKLRHPFERKLVKVDFSLASNTNRTALKGASRFSKDCPTRVYLTWSKRSKSESVRSGEYVGWGTFFMLFWFNNVSLALVVCEWP
jgi:hypothetical protein